MKGRSSANQFPGLSGCALELFRVEAMNHFCVDCFLSTVLEEGSGGSLFLYSHCLLHIRQQRLCTCYLILASCKKSNLLPPQLIGKVAVIPCV